MLYTNELEFAKQLAKKAGDIMLKYFHEDIDVEMKGDNTPLTIADTTINKLVIDEITRQFPSHGIIGEEGCGGAISAEYEWICDPIDGTIPYSIKFPNSMFSLALYKNKQPVLGVLYDPYINKLYHAVEGGPSYCNDKIISVKKGQFQKGDSVGVINVFGSGTFDTNFYNLTKILNEKMMRTEEIHCLVYFAAAVASGRMKLALTPGGYTWDRAASLIIVRAAGGLVTDENGIEATTFGNQKNLIFSNGDVHDEALELLGRN